MTTKDLFRIISLVLLLALTLVLSVEAACAGGLDRWHWRNPAAGANSLTGVTFGGGNFVAVGEWGSIQTSTDGIAWTFQPRQTSQTLNSVIYANQLYVAVGESGSILTSADGTNWNMRNTGLTNSLLAVAYGNSKYVAVGKGGAVVTSSDGVAWTPVSAELSHNLSSLAFGNGLFMTVGTNASQVLTSADGQNWAAHKVVEPLPGCNFSLYQLTFGNGKFLAFARRQEPNDLYPELPNRFWFGYYSSTDGVNWTQSATLWDSDVNSGDFPQHGFLAFANDRFFEFYWQYLGESRVQVTSSQDGQTWSSAVSPSSSFNPFPISDVAYGNGTYVVVGPTGFVFTSPDGINWTLRSGGQDTLTGVTGGDGIYAAVGAGTLVSTNGLRFWQASSTVTQRLSNVAQHSNVFVAVGKEGALHRSTDGLDWSVRPSGTSQDLEAVCNANNQWVAVGAAGTIVTSPSGLAWTSRSSGTEYPLSGVGYGKGLYIAVGHMGTILTSPDAVTWTVQETPTLNSLCGIAFGNDLFVVVGEKGTVLTSTDGSSWLEQSSGTTNTLYGVAFGQGRFVAAGAPQPGFPGNVLLWSLDGVHWSNLTDSLPTGLGLYGIAFVDNTFWLCGESGSLLQSDPVSNQPLLGWKILPGSDACQLTVIGTPGQTYRLQASSQIDAKDWEDLGSVTNNQVQSIDITGNQRFYRLVAP